MKLSNELTLAHRESLAKEFEMLALEARKGKIAAMAIALVGLNASGELGCEVIVAGETEVNEMLDGAIEKMKRGMDQARLIEIVLENVSGDEATSEAVH